MPRSRLPSRPYRVSPLALEHDLPAVTDYHLGCGMLRLLEQGFPRFWQEHCHQRLLTDQTLYGAIQAFLSLVNRHWFEIEELDCFDRSLQHEPAAVFDQVVIDPLGQLREEWRSILSPQPIYVGVGINDILEEHAEADLLTLLIWRLLADTNWSFGVGESMEAFFANSWGAGTDQYTLILAQPPLPAGTTMQDVCAVLDSWQPAPALGPLLAYAVGQTSNVFADASMYDLYAGYDGMDMWDWSDAAFIAQEQQCAMQIATGYTAWSCVVDERPEILIPEIATLLHAAARGALPVLPPAPPWGSLQGPLAEHLTSRAARALPVPDGFATRSARSKS